MWFSIEFVSSEKNQMFFRTSFNLRVAVDAAEAIFENP